TRVEGYQVDRLPQSGQQLRSRGDQIRIGEIDRIERQEPRRLTPLRAGLALVALDSTRPDANRTQILQRAYAASDDQTPPLLLGFPGAGGVPGCAHLLHHAPPPSPARAGSGASAESVRSAIQPSARARRAGRSGPCQLKQPRPSVWMTI